jgi:L-alanine-DL-glutamate epimerase-like enolase superfamily enzyme
LASKLIFPLNSVNKRSSSQEPFWVKDSKIEIPDRPGAGIDWEEAAVKRYAI